jgi:hypothetical protein
MPVLRSIVNFLNCSRDEGGTAGSTKLSANATCGNLTDMRVCDSGVNARKSLTRFRSRAEVGQVPDQQDVWKTLWETGPIMAENGVNAK